MKVATDRKITFKIIEDITNKVMDGSNRPSQRLETTEVATAQQQVPRRNPDPFRFLIDLVEKKSDQINSLLEQLENIHKAYSQQIINCNALVRQNHELTKRLTTQFTKG